MFVPNVSILYTRAAVKSTQRGRSSILHRVIYTHNDILLIIAKLFAENINTTDVLRVVAHAYTHFYEIAFSISSSSSVTFDMRLSSTNEPSPEIRNVLSRPY